MGDKSGELAGQSRIGIKLWSQFSSHWTVAPAVCARALSWCSMAEFVSFLSRRGMFFSRRSLRTLLTGDEFLRLNRIFPLRNLLDNLPDICEGDVQFSGNRSPRPGIGDGWWNFPLSKWCSQNMLYANAASPASLRAWSLPESPTFFPG